MHVDSSQPLGPRQPGRTDSRPAQRPAAADSGRGTPLRDVYEGAAAQAADNASPDRVELSSAGQNLGKDLLPGPTGLETPEARAARVESLARDLAEGRLFSPERLQRAASRLLGGE